MSEKLMRDESLIYYAVKNGFCFDGVYDTMNPLLKTIISNILYFYKKSYSEFKEILIASKLTITGASAQLFNISYEFNESSNSYIITVVPLSGETYIFDDIGKEVTYNYIASKIYEQNNFFTFIIFIGNENNIFDLTNFDDRIISDI